MKLLKLILITGIVLVTVVGLTSLAFAQGPVDRQPVVNQGQALNPISGGMFGQDPQAAGPRRGGNGSGQGYVDENGDGVCDNQGSGYQDADGDGVCDNAGQGQGPGYQDADGDGVCDNAGQGQGQGQQGRRGQGRGRR